MSELDAGGLRERKKRATREAIESAAIDLALMHGYEKLTVEMICEVAVISQRTFFNYVGSKEGAILGTATPLPSEELRAAFVAGRGGSVLEDLIETLAAAAVEIGSTQGVLFQKRRQIIQATPELALREFARLEEAEESILQLVRQRLRSAAATDDAARLDEEARMIVSLTFGIMHYVARVWMESDFAEDVGEVMRRAVQLARRAVTLR